MFLALFIAEYYTFLALRESVTLIGLQRSRVLSLKSDNHLKRKAIMTRAVFMTRKSHGARFVSHSIAKSSQYSWREYVYNKWKCLFSVIIQFYYLPKSNTDYRLRHQSLLLLDRLIKLHNDTNTSLWLYNKPRIFFWMISFTLKVNWFVLSNIGINIIL